MTGTEQVVLGDLVYCKENASGEALGFVDREITDGGDDTYNSFDEDEVPGMDVPEESNSNVKVSVC